MIHPDEEIIAGSNQRFRVVDVVPFDEEDSPFVGMPEGRGCVGSSVVPGGGIGSCGRITGTPVAAFSMRAWGAVIAAGG